MEHTIAAIATPIGTGAVSMIRVSGKDCFFICDKIFNKNKNFLLESASPNTIHYGKIIDLNTKKTIDEVMAAVFKEPLSYTGENSVEIYCHGGMQITSRVLEEIIRAGASLAGPGEFTKRAFLNGKLDLSQAEAVIDLINSKSDIASSVAVGQLEGSIKSGIQEIREKLVLALSHILAYIDFPDEDVEYIDENEVMGLLSEAQKQTQDLINSYYSGKAIVQGIDCVITGLVNAGKSSLMNCLTGDKTSIVTDIAGTTRDVVSKSVRIGNAILNLLDTAGIRKSEEHVEKIGIELAKATVDKAELVLLVIDASRETLPEDKEFYFSIKDKQIIFVANKCDLTQKYDKGFYNGKGKIIEVSAKAAQGIDALKREIEDNLINKDIDLKNDKIITNIRHFETLKVAKQDLESAIEGLNNGFTFDVISIDIQNAIEALGEISGLCVSDEIIDNIFKRFCIGK